MSQWAPKYYLISASSCILQLLLAAKPHTFLFGYVQFCGLLSSFCSSWDDLRVASQGCSVLHWLDAASHHGGFAPFITCVMFHGSAACTDV